MNDHFKTICELLNGQSSLNSVVNKTVSWTGNMYHYSSNQKTIKGILTSKALIPIDKLGRTDRITDYAEQAKDNNISGYSPENDAYDNAMVYWKFIYNKYYKPVVKKPYRNYGIYLTPLDLFKFDNSMKFRIKIPYDRIKNLIKNRDVIIAYGIKKVKLVTDVKDIDESLSSLGTYDDVEKSWNKSNMKFRNLPQIVIFANSIPISLADIEKRTGLMSEALITELSTEQRQKLKDSDFGLSKLRKYPLHDKQHVVLSVRGFYKCPEENKPELARSLLKAAKKFGVNIKSPEVHEYSKRG